LCTLWYSSGNNNDDDDNNDDDNNNNNNNNTVEYEDKGDLIILIVRTHQHNTNSTMLQKAINTKENYREEADK